MVWRFSRHSPCAGSDTGALLKACRKVASAAKAACAGYLPKRQAGAAQKLACNGHAAHLVALQHIRGVAAWYGAGDQQRQRVVAFSVEVA